MTVPNRNYQSPEYRYGFQGQEKDDEVKGSGNSINYKYRMHDPRIGRFFAVDPLSPKYPWYTPYQFSGNKVIHMVELEGLEEAIPERGKSKTRDEGEVSCNNVYHCGTENGDTVFDEGWYSESDYKLIYPNAKRNSVVQSLRPVDKNGTQMSLSAIMLTPTLGGLRSGGLVTSGEIAGGTVIGGAVVAGTILYGLSQYYKAQEIVWYNNETVLPVTITTTAPFDIPKDYTKNKEGFITLYRGVASDDIWGTPNPAYPPSIGGLAVPQGGSANSVGANLGKPSNFTFWSTSPLVAYGFATKGQTGIGTVIVTRVPWGMAMPNSSPNAFINEGEVQMLGSVQGVPIPVFK